MEKVETQKLQTNIIMKGVRNKSEGKTKYMFRLRIIGDREEHVSSKNVTYQHAFEVKIVVISECCVVVLVLVFVLMLKMFKNVNAKKCIGEGQP